MTEEEKKRRALELFAAEQARLRSRSPLSNPAFDKQMKKIDRRTALFSGLAQQGITFDDLKLAYDTEYERGKKEMVEFRVGFFYASAAIAVHELYSTDTDHTLFFLETVARKMDAYKSKEAIIAACLQATGVDVRGVDPETKPVRNTRADRRAAERMRRSGITEKDLEYEKQAGYANGWNTEFFLSACYASVGLTVHEMFGAAGDEVENILDRMTEICDEEISRVDILERAQRETGIDVSGIMRI